MDNTSALSVARILIGAAAWLAPEHRLWSGMLRSPAQSQYTMRLFGAREAALGAMTLMAAPSAKPALLKVGIAVDSADAAAGVMAMRSGALSSPMGLLLTAVAAGAIAAGVAGLGQ